MSSGFVSGGTIDNPTERDEAWRRAQAELEKKRRQKATEGQQHDGKSLYEVLQANKAAKQEAFEEAARLKNQYRALDDDEAEFLESVLEGKRRKEAEVVKETMAQLEAFRRRQEEAERKAFEEEQNTDKGKDDGAESHAQWVAAGRKRKKGHELLKGVKIRRKSSAEEEKAIEDGGKDEKTAAMETKPDASPVVPSSADHNASIATPTKPTSTSPPAKPSAPVGLNLGYASSDEDD